MTRERRGEGGREAWKVGGLLHGGEAENGSSKVHQFQDLFCFIFKTSGLCQWQRYKSRLHTAAWDYFIQEAG